MARELFENMDKMYILRRSKLEERWDNIWMANYNLLLKYIEEYGNHNFPHSYKTKEYKPEYKKLPKWYIHQRELNVKNDLPKWRYELLEEIGFDFKPLDTQWRGKYNKVKEFAQIYGHCNISQFDEDYPGLGKWLNSQRTNRATLNKTNINLLRAVKISWRMYAQEWDEMYVMLKKYYLKNGPIVAMRQKYSGAQNNPSARFKKLNTWVNHQIREYIKGTLPKDKIKLLEKFEFIFEIYKQAPESKPIKLQPFDLYFDQLVAYKKKYGNYNVPLYWNKDPKFAKWVHSLRSKKTIMPQYQRDDLNRIGFTWSIVDERWEENFKKLLEYKKLNGHCYVYSSHPDRTLVNWSRKIRYARKNLDYSKLTDEKIKRLNEIGFDW